MEDGVILMIDGFQIDHLSCWLNCSDGKLKVSEKNWF